MVTMESQSPLGTEEIKIKYIKILLKLFFKYPIIISDQVKFPPSPTPLSITLTLQRRLNLGTELKILLLPKDIVTV